MWTHKFSHLFIREPFTLAESLKGLRLTRKVITPNGFKNLMMKVTGTTAFALLFLLSSLNVASINFHDDSLNEQMISESSRGNEIPCIDSDEVIYEYGFGFSFAHNNNLRVLSNDLPPSECETPSIQKSGSWLHVLQDDTEQITLEEILRIFQVDFESDLFFGNLIDAWSYKDCPFSTHDNETNGATRCNFAAVSIDGRSFSLLDAVQEGMKINHADNVVLNIRDETRYQEYGWLTDIEDINGCLDSSEQYLPTYSHSLAEVLIQCEKESTKSLVYDLRGITRQHNSGFPLVEDFDSDVHVINPGTQGKFLWVEFSLTGDVVLDKCSIRFMTNGINTQPEIYRELILDSSEVNYGSCQNFIFHSMSFDESYSIISADNLGVISVDMNTMEYSVFLGDINYLKSGAWMGKSNNFAYMDDQWEKIARYDAHAGSFGWIMTLQDVENGPFEWDYTTIESAPYLSNETLMVFGKSWKNGQEVWSAKRIDFEWDFQSFQEISNTNFAGKNWQQQPGCGSNHPAFGFEMGADLYEYQTNDGDDLVIYMGGFVPSQCHRHIIIGESSNKIENQQTRMIITIDEEVSVRSDITDYVQRCLYAEDFDGDGTKDHCDFDVDGDGVKNWDDDCDFTESTIHIDLQGNGCFSLEPDDIDMDGILNGFDNCEDGFRNWSSIDNPTEGWGIYDNDNDGCHDIIEDDDDDNDGHLDINDDCPYRSNGHIDMDGDGLCSGDDADDDGDGFSDQDEETCGSNSTNFTSLPLDTDSDMICNDIDDDMDGDNFTNELDAFPLDGSEWNDLDEDGIGNNSDDCVGTYGTSTVDRLGCLDQDGDGVSDLNDLDPYDAKIGLDEYDGPRLDLVEENEANLSTNQTDIASESDGVVVYSTIGVLCIAGIIIFVRSRTSSPDDEEEEFGEADEFYRNVTTTPVASSDEPSIQSTPDFSLSGSQHESGYEVLEYPEDSENWWWKDEENQCWVPWE